MGRYTKQDVIDLVRENDVEFIRLQFSDLFGTMKNVAITARQLEKALDNKCTFDGSSVDGFVRIEESDLDINTYLILPHLQPLPRKKHQTYSGYPMLFQAVLLLPPYFSSFQKISVNCNLMKATSSSSTM